MPEVRKKYFCKTCKKMMTENMFYTSRRLDRYPNDGKLTECRECITRHVDNWDPETYKWILEECDVPYIPDEWNKLMLKYAENADRSKVSGMTIMGRYLAKMRMAQFKNLRWADSDSYNEKLMASKQEAMRESGDYTEEEIEQLSQTVQTSELLSKADFMPVEEEVPPEAPEPLLSLEPIGFHDELTEQDKIEMSLKWGTTYKPYEWVRLEQFYRDMTEVFEIKTPAHIDYLKLICKTSLKAHQLLDLGD